MSYFKEWITETSKPLKQVYISLNWYKNAEYRSKEYTGDY